jgi:membrane associated rhomboid family serine protease
MVETSYSMSQVSEISVRVAPRRQLAEEWALVLVAEGLTPRVAPTGDKFVISVPAEQHESANAALAAYERENPLLPDDNAEEPRGSAHLYVALAVSVALVDMYFVTDVWHQAVHWLERGGADAGRILNGELWRAVTALTLHADFKHALGNAIAGAIFLTAVGRALGPGLGCALVLLSGVAGNLLNAFVHPAFHVSVGASTAVFGALGMLGGLGVVRRHRLGWRGRRAWLPIAAGLGLLAFLGTAGERVDLWAHLFGFVFGAVLGIVAALIVKRRPGARFQWLWGLSALALIVCSWMLALQAGT